MRLSYGCVNSCVPSVIDSMSLLWCRIQPSGSADKTLKTGRHVNLGESGTQGKGKGSPYLKPQIDRLPV